ncbi:MAG: hypothetical protein BGP04_04160 [Rhizobiales bacterium 62-17]|nr:MAG: hypothetical protein BGP04_04160 [Rhizobiales bacterium 62-17]
MYLEFWVTLLAGSLHLADLAGRSDQPGAVGFDEGFEGDGILIGRRASRLLEYMLDRGIRHRRFIASSSLRVTAAGRPFGANNPAQM